MPLQFWKIVVWREGDELMYSSFLLDQGEELRADQAASGGLELDLEVPEGVREIDVAEIEARTGLSFGDL